MDRRIRAALNELGWVESRTVAIEMR